MEKIGLVTGGTLGIGRAIVEDLRRDHSVTFTWLSTEPDPNSEGEDLQPIRSDLTQDGQPEAVIRDVVERFGRLDVIVNNAGLVRSTPKEDFDREDHRAILDLNLLVPAA